MAREVEDLDALAHVLFGARHLVSAQAMRLEEYERIGVEFEDIGHRLPSLAVKLAGVGNKTSALLQRGAISSWRRETDRFETLVGDRSLSFFQLDVLLNRAQRAFLVGDLHRAEDALEMAPLVSSIGHEPALWTGATMLLIWRFQSRDADLRVGLEQLIARGNDVADYQCLLAAVQARAGSTEAARHTMAEFRERVCAHGVLPMVARHDGTRRGGRGRWQSGDCTPCARRMRSLLGPNRGLRNMHQPTPRSSPAQAALASDDGALAEQFASRAVAASRERQTPVFLCRELVFLAEARQRNGASRVELRPLVYEAVVLADRVGAHIVLDDLERYRLPR